MDTEIRSMHFDPTTRGQPFAPITGLEGAAGLDFDYLDSTIYFSQVTQQKLSRYILKSKTTEDFATSSSEN